MCLTKPFQCDIIGVRPCVYIYIYTNYILSLHEEIDCDIIVKRELCSHPCCDTANRPKGGKTMRKYEIMYIIRPTVLEDDRKQVIADLNEIFTSRGGELLDVNEWGMKDLAYEIQKHKKGYYVVLSVNCTDEARAEFDRVVRIREDIIRHLIIRDER